MWSEWISGAVLNNFQTSVCLHEIQWALACSKAFQIHTMDNDSTQLLISQEKTPGAILHLCVAHTKLFTWGVLGLLFKQPRSTLLTFHNGNGRRYHI